jgi:archaemetzincin
MSDCNHVPLHFGVVDSVTFKYRQPKAEILRKAQIGTTSSRKRKAPELDEAAHPDHAVQHADSTFPAPVVLPGDDLFEDPDYPPQSVQEWMKYDVPNVAKNRRVLYVVPPPTYSEDVGFLKAWTTPRVDRNKGNDPSGDVQQPKIDDIVEYLTAFYHPMPVQVLSEPGLQFQAWTERKRTRANTVVPTAVGLSTGSEMVRIRCRASRDVFGGQLDLNDLLDTAISILPKDAFALLMLVHHDIYEGKDDDFCCGRAYGGSHVAVVSSARYRPALDEHHNVDRGHSWPASHCMSYVGSHYSGKRPAVSSGNVQDLETLYPASAVAPAVLASSPLAFASTATELDTLWLGRVCKTASHELGHCFGIDHCTYYACIMQGTSCMAEDVRQPPYMCPVDLTKLLRATGGDEKERYTALLDFCRKWKDDRMFAAFAAWLEVRLRQPNVSEG